jgi:predicted  nucleic acid-binding Zn-ribbon protein
VSYQKNALSAAVIELPYAPDIVNAAMNDYLSKKGKSKGTDLKGFSTFRNTEALAYDSTNADLYFKIERKSRQEKNTSLVSLLLSSPKADMSTANIRYLNMAEAQDYLNGLVPAIDAYNLELKIKEQNEVIKKAETKYKSLVNDGEDLENKKTEIEKKIAENKQDIQSQGNEVEAQKQKLAAWVSTRK